MYKRLYLLVFLIVVGTIITMTSTYLFYRTALTASEAPRWYLYKNNIEFRNGMELEITGSKFLSKEGTFYISARKIKFTESEKTIELRDSHCKPMWRRMH